MITLYQIRLPHATFGIEVCDGVVTKAAPIAKWTVGKKSSEVIGYYMRRYPCAEARAVTEPSSSSPGSRRGWCICNWSAVRTG
jgi:hypothetical protein